MVEIRSTIAAIAAVTIALFGVSTPASAAPRWLDGQHQASTILNCPSVIRRQIALKLRLVPTGVAGGSGTVPMATSVVRR
jgi:hypothetical protein